MWSALLPILPVLPNPAHMDYLLWQLADSGFPAGGFAHSGGLEAAIHHGAVSDSVSLRLFVLDTIAQSGHGALPLVTGAHGAPEDLHDLDALCDAFLANTVANRASRAQGRAFLSTCRRSFPQDALEKLERDVRETNLAGHYPPLFGAVLNALGIDRLDTQRLFLYLGSRAVMSAAVRLGVVGAYEAQRLQTATAPDLERAIERCGHLRPLDITHTAPLIDLRQSTHDRLYSRLFQS